MSHRFGRLSEAQIRKAQAEGQFQDLAGAGKPLPHRLGDAFVSIGDSVGHRIMAEAGALPEEIKLRKAIATAQTDYKSLSNEAEKKAAMADLAELQMRLGIAEEARRRFFGN